VDAGCRFCVVRIGTHEWQNLDTMRQSGPDDQTACSHCPTSLKHRRAKKHMSSCKTRGWHSIPRGKKYGFDFDTKNPSTISILLDIDVPHFCTVMFFCFSMFFDVFRMSAQSFWCSTVARVKACFVACSKHVFSHRSGGSFWRKLQAEFRSTSTSATSFRVPSGR